MNIIRQQKSPNPFKIRWYQLTRSRVKKSLAQNGDLSPVFEGLNVLEGKVTNTKRQQNEKTVSMEALKKFIELKLPAILKRIEYTVVKSPVNSVSIDEVEIIVAPDLIIKGEIGSKIAYGAIKIHISKNEPFDLQQLQMSSSIICKFLNKKVKCKDEVVIPELCFSLDIFGERMVSAKSLPSGIESEIQEICAEIKRLWPAAA